jgi:hypothetical protein
MLRNTARAETLQSRPRRRSAGRRSRRDEVLPLDGTDERTERKCELLSRGRLHPSSIDPRIDFGRIEPNELAQFAERSPALIDHPADEAGTDAKTLCDSVHIEQGGRCR